MTETKLPFDNWTEILMDEGIELNKCKKLIIWSVLPISNIQELLKDANKLVWWANKANKYEESGKVVL